MFTFFKTELTTRERMSLLKQVADLDGLPFDMEAMCAQEEALIAQRQVEARRFFCRGVWVLLLITAAIQVTAVLVEGLGQMNMLRGAGLIGLDVLVTLFMSAIFTRALFPDWGH